MIGKWRAGIKQLHHQGSILGHITRHFPPGRGSGHVDSPRRPDQSTAGPVGKDVNDGREGVVVQQRCVLRGGAGLRLQSLRPRGAVDVALGVKGDGDAAGHGLGGGGSGAAVVDDGGGGGALSADADAAGDFVVRRLHRQAGTSGCRVLPTSHSPWTRAQKDERNIILLKGRQATPSLHWDAYIGRIESSFQDLGLESGFYPLTFTAAEKLKPLLCRLAAETAEVCRNTLASAPVGAGMQGERGGEDGQGLQTLSARTP